MDITLTDVEGISETTERQLAETEFDSVEAIASAKPEELETVKGFGPSRAEEIVTNASELLAEAETATTDAEDLDTVTVSYEIPAEVGFFVLDGLLTEAVMLQSRNQLADRNLAYSLCHDYMAQFVDADAVHGDDDTFTVEFDVRMDELNILKRAFSAVATEYSSKRGFDNAYGHLSNLVDAVDEDRDTHWGM